jgi:antitoxin component YwqK of YwqJK toxin-antitoxin module
MRKNLQILVVMIMFTVFGKAQNVTDEVYTFCHVIPEFPGGDTAYNHFLNSNIRLPDDLIKSNLDGMAVVQFVVEKDGALSTVEIKKSISKSMDDEIVRVFKAMPKWSPAKVSDSLVRYQYAIPIVVAQMDYMKFDSLVEYVDSNYAVVDKDLSTHYKVIKNERKCFFVSCYLKNGTLVETYECTKLMPEVKHGRCKIYYDNQKIKIEGKYNKGKKNGTFDSYDRDGVQISKEVFADDTLNGFSIYYNELADAKFLERIYRKGVLRCIFKSDSITYEEPEIFTIVEESPEFMGGNEARMRFFKENLQFPKNATSGTVYTQFVVEYDGTITNPRINRGIGAGCDQEALRLIRLMPKWKPGKQRGKAVRCQFMLPIKFS